MTRSPTFSSIGMTSPFSRRPGPTARISPWIGFSLAVSGMYSPRADDEARARVGERDKQPCGLARTGVGVCEEDQGGRGPAAASEPLTHAIAVFSHRAG